MPTTGFQKHDHKLCIADALSRARSICSLRGVQLTPLRQQVLELLWRSHRPLGAYALMDLLRDAQDHTEVKPIAPPTVYRALDFLAQHHLAHRLASLNAYIGCPDPANPHSSHFFICSGCENTLEVQSKPLTRAIARCASEAGFSVQQEMVEVSGLCPNCRSPG